MSKTTFFRLDGGNYENEAEKPDLTGKEVRRFTYGQEPKVIRQRRPCQ